MRLASFQVDYFRSIKKSEPIVLNQKTIIVGKNNEGKSNYLKAFNIALTILLDRRRAGHYMNYHRYFTDEMFNWERDYPINMQSKSRQPKTRFILVFDLSENDIASIGKLINKTISKQLIVEIEVSRVEFETLIYHIPRGKKVKLKETSILCDYITREINFTYIPTIRTEKTSLSIIDSLINQKLDGLKNNQEYIKAQETIKNMQNNLLDNLSKELMEKLNTFVPNLKHVQLSTDSEHRYSYGMRSNFKFIVDDGNPTEISYKGDGFKSLVTLALLHDKGQSTKSNIIAIEEPEAHLHPGAIHDLKDILDDIYQNNQILLTTHNQVFIDRENISNNIIVDDGKIKKVKDIKQLRNILGVELSDNLTSCEKVLLVEGSSDVKFLNHLFPLLNNNIRDKIKKGQLVITSIGGIKYLQQYINFYKNVLCDVFVLTDNDIPARQIQEDILTKQLLKTSNMFLIDNSKGEKELEDIIKPNIIETFFKEGIFTEFDLEKYNRKKIKWSEEIKNQFEEKGHLFNDHIEAEIKTDLVEYLIKNNILECIKEPNLRILKNLADRLCE